MNEQVIQHQIKLAAFKAARVELFCQSHDSLTTLPADFNLELGDLTFPDFPKVFAKVFYVKLVAFPEGEPQIQETIHVNVEYHTIFECSEIIDSKFLSSDFAKISAPAIGFPYVRAFISSLTTQAGLPTIILPSINFVQFSKTMGQEKKNEKG